MRLEQTKERILELLFDFPTHRFHIREIARILKISAPAVSKAVYKLEKEDLITCKREFVFEITAKMGDKFKSLKRIHNLKKIYESGLADYLAEKFPFATIILFGSYSRGEDIEKSDIDIAILDKEKKLELEKFEKKLNRTINVEFINFKKASLELKENLVNGIVLSGTLSLK